jgi:hypothetical protein
MMKQNNLYDYKFTSVWNIKSNLEKPKDEYVQQMNIQSYLLNRNNIEVDTLSIVALARDWNQHGALRDPNYPPQAAVIPIPMMTFDEQEQMIANLVFEHQADNPRPCTDEERWKQDDSWAVKKKNNKRALKVHWDEQSANDHLDELGDGYIIEFRPGEYKRCESYCDVARFCPQFKGK